MRVIEKRRACFALLGFLTLAALPGAAEARWWGPGYYGYGTYYAPPPVYVEPPVYVVPRVYVAPPVYAPPPVQGAAPSQSWYYCDNPQGYYPHVPECSTAWRQVPTIPSR